MTESVPQNPRRRSDEDAGIVVRVYALTDVGHTREHNEDTFLVADLEEGRPLLFESMATKEVRPGDHGLLFLVADGMGGAASGELASSMASSTVLETLEDRWSNSGTISPEEFATALRDATCDANERIHKHSRENPEHRGMGTTATIAGLLNDHVYVAQVGDSRAYLIRDGRAIQLTKDQSLMQRLVEAGEISQEEAEQSERRNIILQALGPEPQITIDLTHQQLRKGDTLLLCSDGLSGLVRAEEIARLASSEQDVSTLCHKLVTRANELGGPDNITVVAVRVEGDGLQPSQINDRVGHVAFPLHGTLSTDDPTPRQTKAIRSDPTPAAGSPMPTRAAIAEEFRRAREADAAAAAAAEKRTEPIDRKERAFPIMVMLGILAAATALWTLWHYLRPAR